VGINDAGQAVGSSNLGSLGYAALWSPSHPISTVPEPSTWAMMLIGFASLGFAGYRTSRNSVAADA
jgi:PEP-CTERM motif